MDNKKKEENIGFHITKPILPGIDVCNEKKKKEKHYESTERQPWGFNYYYYFNF